jgi:hypothetical protein
MLKLKKQGRAYTVCLLCLTLKKEKGRFDFGLFLLVTGINSVIKGFPWYDPKMLDPNRWDQLEQWGFNAVRSGRAA